MFEALLCCLSLLLLCSPLSLSFSLSLPLNPISSLPVAMRARVCMFVTV